MKLIQPSVQILPQSPGLEGIYQQIERVGRTCYKSEDKITPTSAKPFVDKMIQAHHYAMLEHGTVYLTIDNNNVRYCELKSFYSKNKYSRIGTTPLGVSYITTNMRVIIENNRGKDLEFITEPVVHHYKRLTLKFNTNIGISRECNRHRTFSIAEQSTRYCNYSKDKFNNEITFIIPSWVEDVTMLKIGGYKHQLPDEAIDWGTENLLGCLFRASEFVYKGLLDQGWKPQQAREVLPLATATEVVYTAFLDDWTHFFDLRLRGTTGAPHPNMLQIATLAHNLIKEQLGITL